MTEKEKNKTSKFLSLVLRHKPEEIGLVLDVNGWANVEELLQKIDLKFEDLQKIVTTNNKKRFTFSDDLSKIRANQGHSINVDLELSEITPPEILFHGTAEKNMYSILKNGLLKKDRNHVHLSTEIETATKVGIRYGKPVILKIDALKMYQEGYKFYLSQNNVWLTDFVPKKFINHQTHLIP